MAETVGATPNSPASVTVPLVPTPISEINNSGLRDSINKALEGVPAGHGHALLNVDNKGAGVMVVQRFNERWALVAAVKYTKADGVRPQVAVKASW